jgi:5'-phosphate synthase pdxT subunit
VRVGVLALQGAFVEHRHALERLGHEVVEVRLPDDLASVDALVIPGGESTTIGKLLVDYSLLEPIRRRVQEGMPTLGTCAGAIVLAKDIGRDQPLIGTMDMVVNRNAFGRQIQSFETDLRIPAIGEKPIRAIFIRAPIITSVGPKAEVLARLDDGTIVAARQGNMVATAFHPELSGDDRFHAYWLETTATAGAR